MALGRAGESYRVSERTPHSNICKRSGHMESAYLHEHTIGTPTNMPYGTIAMLHSWRQLPGGGLVDMLKKVLAVGLVGISMSGREG